MLIGKSQYGSTGRSAPYRFRCRRVEKNKIKNKRGKVDKDMPSADLRVS
jgi:hypothetical protein